MMTDEDIVDFVLNYEGPPHLDPGDPGGETKWGMTKPTWDAISSMRGEGLPFAEISRSDIAVGVFWYYFLHLGITKVQSSAGKLALFDMCYLQGAHAMCECFIMDKFPSKSDPAGYAGILHEAALMTPRSLVIHVSQYRLSEFYHDLDLNPFHPFAWGWVNRLHLIVQRCQAELAA